MGVYTNITLKTVTLYTTFHTNLSHIPCIQSFLSAFTLLSLPPNYIHVTTKGSPLKFITSQIVQLQYYNMIQVRDLQRNTSPKQYTVLTCCYLRKVANQMTSILVHFCSNIKHERLHIKIKCFVVQKQFS